MKLVGVHVTSVDVHGPLWVDELNRLAVVHGVGGAQYRVPVDDRLGGAFQRRHVDIATDPPGVTDGVRGTAGCELVEEPQRLLSVGQCMRRPVLGLLGLPGKRCIGVGCHGLIRLHRTVARKSVAEPAGETGDACSIQQLDDRHSDAQVALNLGAQLDRDERVDLKVVEGYRNVETRRRHSELAGNLIAQVRLEQPLALLPVRPARSDFKARFVSIRVRVAGGHLAHRCPHQVADQRRGQTVAQFGAEQAPRRAEGPRGPGYDRLEESGGRQDRRPIHPVVRRRAVGSDGVQPETLALPRVGGRGDASSVRWV